MSKKKPNSARTLIQSLGGPTRVAELLGYDKQRGGVQRVANWQARGIPAEVRLERPDIFPPENTLRSRSHLHGAERLSDCSAGVPAERGEVANG